MKIGVFTVCMPDYEPLEKRLTDNIEWFRGLVCG